MQPENPQSGEELDDIKFLQRDTQHKELMDALEALTLATLKDKRTELKGAEIVTIKGVKGDSPSKEELVSIMKPLIPAPIKGEKGDSIVGPQGLKGERGERGETPVAGVDFPFPKDGEDGRTIHTVEYLKDAPRKAKKGDLCFVTSTLDILRYE